MTHRVLAALLVVAAVAGTASCTRGGVSPEVTLTMTEFELAVDPDEAASGRVRFFVDNEGTEEHGLVFTYAADAADLPLAPDGSVDLSGVNVVDQLEPVAPGRFRIEPLLRPGTMVVFCNLVTEGPDGQPVSHFQQGMWVSLTVTGDEPGADDDPAP
jgi:hypothetical protein